MSESKVTLFKEVDLNESVFGEAGFDVHVISTLRLNPLQTTHTDFYCAAKIPIPSGGDFNRGCLVAATIPKTNTLVNAPNNTFVLTEQGVNFTCTVVPANYAPTQVWCTYIATVLTSASTSMGHNWVYTAAKPAQDNGHVNYSVTNNGGNQPSFTINSSGDLSGQLGFPVGTTAFVGSKLQSTYVYNSNGEFTLHVNTDLLEADGDQAVADIPTGVVPYMGSIYYQSQHPVLNSKRFMRKGNSDSYHFWVNQSTNGQPYNTQGVPIHLHFKLYRDAQVAERKAQLDVLKQMCSFLEQMAASLKALETKALEAPTMLSTEEPHPDGFEADPNAIPEVNVDGAVDTAVEDPIPEVEVDGPEPKVKALPEGHDPIPEVNVDGDEGDGFEHV